MKKLKLNKERIAHLSNQESSNIHGGGTVYSTNKGFTCCWCTSETGTEEPRCETYECSTYDPTMGCPPDLQQLQG